LDTGRGAAECALRGSGGALRRQCFHEEAALGQALI
jgi:hypothetical protein